MKTNRRISEAASVVADNINSLSTKTLDLQNAKLRQAFAILDTLEWALGKMVPSPELKVDSLLNMYRREIREQKTRQDGRKAG